MVESSVLGDIKTLEQLQGAGLEVNLHRRLGTLTCVQIGFPEIDLNDLVTQKCAGVECDEHMDPVLRVVDWQIGDSRVITRFRNVLSYVCQGCQTVEYPDGSQRGAMDSVLRFITDRVEASGLGSQIPSVRELEIILR